MSRTIKVGPYTATRWPQGQEGWDITGPKGVLDAPDELLTALARLVHRLRQERKPRHRIGAKP